MSSMRVRIPVGSANGVSGISTGSKMFCLQVTRGAVGVLPGQVAGMVVEVNASRMLRDAPSNSSWRDAPVFMTPANSAR